MMQIKLSNCTNFQIIKLKFMARPVSYNIKEKPLEKDISIVDMPDGYQGEGFFASN